MAESRRITGPHLLLDRPGAVVELTREDPEVVAGRARGAAERLGWPVYTAIRRHATGSTVAMEAPPDLLYTACSVLDWATGDLEWVKVEEELNHEENQRLRELLAVSHSPVFADDDYGFTAGLGRYARTWPLDALPAELSPRERIPFVFLTGTNGKTTTTRMLTRIALAAGFMPGWTSSDAYGVGRDVVESGDWTGPGAARAVLRHPEVDFACLETARGGLLRRGLVIAGADAAVVTNVSSDHLGEYGIHDVADMADAKLGVAYGLRKGGTLVVNAGDSFLCDAVPTVLKRRPDLQVCWFSGDSGEDADAWASDTHLHLGGVAIPLAEIPATYDGTVRHNVENALAAALAARAAGIQPEDIARGLRDFQPSVEESRGRMNRFVLDNGAVFLVDFAHNPDGLARVGQAVARWPAERRLILVGQAGDRTDADLDSLASVVASLDQDVVILKQMERYRRGRPIGEVVARLRHTLEACGQRQIVDVGSEEEGVDWLLENARSGDVVLMLIQANLSYALERIGTRC